MVKFPDPGDPDFDPRIERIVRRALIELDPDDESRRRRIREFEEEEATRH